MLELQQVLKEYHRQTILGPIQLTLPDGIFLGLLGPNNSGKSTLLRLIAGTSKLTGGKILWNHKLLSEDSREDIVFLPDSHLFPFWMTIQDAINFFSYFFRGFDRAKCYEYLTLFSLPLNRKIIHFSKGEREKIKIIFTVSRKAKLYLLDEPFDGVDLVARKTILPLLANLLNEETTVIISSHFVSEMDQLFSHILFLKTGKIVLYGDKDTIQTEMSTSLEEIYKDIYSEVDNHVSFTSL